MVIEHVFFASIGINTSQSTFWEQNFLVLMQAMKFNLTRRHKVIQLGTGGWVRGVPRVNLSVEILYGFIGISTPDITIGEVHRHNRTCTRRNYLFDGAIEKFDQASAVVENALGASIFVGDFLNET